VTRKGNEVTTVNPPLGTTKTSPRRKSMG